MDWLINLYIFATFYYYIFWMIVKYRNWRPKWRKYWPSCRRWTSRTSWVTTWSSASWAVTRYPWAAWAFIWVWPATWTWPIWTCPTCHGSSVMTPSSPLTPMRPFTWKLFNQANGVHSMGGGMVNSMNNHDDVVVVSNGCGMLPDSNLDPNANVYTPITLGNGDL